MGKADTKIVNIVENNNDKHDNWGFGSHFVNKVSKELCATSDAANHPDGCA